MLLGLKKRGFGAGRWNGFGGKVEPGETIEEAAVRETEEETGLTPRGLDLRGILEFSWEDRPEVLEVHVFKCAEFDGEARETEEMRPQWYPFDEIPYPDMWSDDPYWLPHLIAGKAFDASFLFDEKDQVLSHNLRIRQ